MPYQQYVFQWLGRDNLNTGGVKLIGYYDPDGYGGGGTKQIWTKTVASSDYFTTGLANILIMEISTAEGRTKVDIKKNLDRIRITPYNAYNSKVADTEYWYQLKQLVPNGTDLTLKSTLSTYDEVSKNINATRVGKGTLTLAKSGSGYTATLTTTDGPAASGTDYITDFALSRELGSINGSALNVTSNYNQTNYPGMEGAHTIYYRLASAKTTPQN